MPIVARFLNLSKLRFRKHQLSDVYRGRCIPCFCFSYAEDCRVFNDTKHGIVFVRDDYVFRSWSFIINYVISTLKKIYLEAVVQHDTKVSVSVVLFIDVVKKSSEMVHNILWKLDFNFVNKENGFYFPWEQQALLSCLLPINMSLFSFVYRPWHHWMSYLFVFFRLG